MQDIMGVISGVSAKDQPYKRPLDSKKEYAGQIPQDIGKIGPSDAQNFLTMQGYLDNPVLHEKPSVADTSPNEVAKTMEDIINDLT